MDNEEKILAILEQMQTDVSELKTDVSELKTDVSELKTDMQEVKERIIIIENEHGQGIRAALDGNSMNYDILQEVREDIQKLVAGQERQDTDIMALEMRKA